MNSGLNKHVRAEIASVPQFGQLLDLVADCAHDLANDQELMAERVPKEVWIAVCCKWGKHRSVAFVEELYQQLHTCDNPCFSAVHKLHLERHNWDPGARTPEPVPTGWHAPATRLLRAEFGQQPHRVC